jgi:hypothetical protein
MDVKPKGLIKRVLDFAVAEFERRSRPPPAPSDVREDDDTAPVQQRAYAAESTAPVEAQSAEPKPRPSAAAGLHLTRGARGALKVRWAVAPEQLRLAATLIEEGAVLCLRVVSFAAGRDHVTREVQDRPSIAAHGECDLTRPDEGRAVVSIGLRSGGRFVSIAHHVA